MGTARRGAATALSASYGIGAAAQCSGLPDLDLVVSILPFSKEKPMTIIMRQAVAWSILLCSSQVLPAFGQVIVLPQGAPPLRDTQEDPVRQAAARDSRLKQQGQGSNYRVEGKPQPFAAADTTVNPGQASGMQSVQGRIVKSEGDTHTVRQLSGPDATLTVDDHTAGDKKLVPGDVVTGLVTAQGRAVAIHKERRK
jgi:hypothetical protein